MSIIINNGSGSIPALIRTISINVDKTSAVVGNYFIITANIMPSDTNPTIVWLSNNPKIISVELSPGCKTTIAKALSAGTATITCYSTDDRKVSSSITLTSTVDTSTDVRDVNINYLSLSYSSDTVKTFKQSDGLSTYYSTTIPKAYSYDIIWTTSVSNKKPATFYLYFNSVLVSSFDTSWWDDGTILSFVKNITYIFNYTDAYNANNTIPIEVKLKVNEGTSIEDTIYSTKLSITSTYKKK